MVVGAATALPFIPIPVINYIILWEDNSLLKKLEPAMEVESNNVRKSCARRIRVRVVALLQSRYCGIKRRRSFQ
jgi:hypothetical protein